MGRRSRERRARRGWLVPWMMPLLRVLATRVRKAKPRAAYRLALVLGDLLRWSGVTRQVVRRNLALTLGRAPSRAERRRFETRYYRHLALLGVEFLRQPELGLDDLRDMFEPEGLERARDVHAEGRGVIFVTGHSGSWELAGHAAGLLGLQLLSVAKLSGHEAIDGFVSGIREAGGQRIRDVKGSMWAMKKALDRGESVGINVDQEVRQGAVYTPFFGMLASSSSAPALLHLKTGAPILVVAAHRTGPFRYRLEVLDEVRHPKGPDQAADVQIITARLNSALEQGLRLRPEQWLWSHRRWRRRPPGEAPDEFRRIADVPPLELFPEG